jgi:hypothetical protein
MKVKKTTGDRPNLLVKLLGEITERSRTFRDSTLRSLVNDKKDNK